MTDLARKLTAHRRFELVNGMCFETEGGADWIAGIDADGNPNIFGMWADGGELSAGKVIDSDPGHACSDHECDVCISSLNRRHPETAWLKLDDPATFGALWSLLPAGRWTLEMYAARCCVYNSDDVPRSPGVGHSPGEAVARVLLALWERE